MHKELFETFERQFKTLLPRAENDLSHEVKKHIKSAMMSTFERLDLVTREEFDAQKAVLTRSRSKIDELEKKLSAISAQLALDE
jgi:BMFP domain-containing protein YqiC